MSNKNILMNTSYLEGNYNILELIEIILDKYNNTNMEIDYLFNDFGELYVNCYIKDDDDDKEPIELNFN